eukprot:754106-Hanusia_phi.AAC.1
MMRVCVRTAGVKPMLPVISIMLLGRYAEYHALILLPINLPVQASFLDSFAVLEPAVAEKLGRVLLNVDLFLLATSSKLSTSRPDQSCSLLESALHFHKYQRSPNPSLPLRSVSWQRVPKKG